MAEGCLFIEELPDVILDAYGARLSYESAGVLYLRRYPRGLWRRFLEREIRRLNEFELAELAQRKVVKIAEGGHG